MRIIRYIILLASFLFTLQGFANEDQKAAYIDAYSQHVKERSGLMAKVLEHKGMSPEQAKRQADNFMKIGIRCHIEALDLYPPEIRNALFGTVQNGGSYPDAESALKKIVGEAQLDGNSELTEAFVTASRATMACLKVGLPKQ